MKRFLLICASGTALILIPPTAASAQDPGSGGPEPGTSTPTDVPIDAGASVLLAGGVALALRRLRSSRQA